MGMGQILKDVLKEKGMTIKTLSDITGISKNTLYAITKRDSVNVRADNVEKIASALNISPAYLLGWSNKKDGKMSAIDALAFERQKTRGLPIEIKNEDVDIDELFRKVARRIADTDFDNIFPIEKKRIPMLGEIACGEPIFANEDRESYVLAGTDINADFCLKAHGDSMTGARINDGDIVFIKTQSVVDDGEIAAVIIENEATLKRVYYEKDKNRLTLQAENPKYRPLSFEGEELDHIRILGKAVAFQSDII